LQVSCDIIRLGIFVENKDKPELNGLMGQKDVASSLELAEKKIQRLTELDRQHKLFQQELEKRTGELHERVKELNCLYTISAIVEKKGPPLRRYFRGPSISSLTHGSIPRRQQAGSS
jgi:hypothetical protein